MIEYGIQRTPALSKSLWASLVKKYKENMEGKKRNKAWPYFDDMHQILFAGEVAKK